MYGKWNPSHISRCIINFNWKGNRSYYNWRPLTKRVRVRSCTGRHSLAILFSVDTSVLNWVTQGRADYLILWAWAESRHSQIWTLVSRLREHSLPGRTHVRLERTKTSDGKIKPGKYDINEKCLSTQKLRAVPKPVLFLNHKKFIPCPFAILVFTVIAFAEEPDAEAPF